MARDVLDCRWFDDIALDCPLLYAAWRSAARANQLCAPVEFTVEFAITRVGVTRSQPFWRVNVCLISDLLGDTHLFLELATLPFWQRYNRPVWAGRRGRRFDRNAGRQARGSQQSARNHGSDVSHRSADVCHLLARS